MVVIAIVLAGSADIDSWLDRVFKAIVFMIAFYGLVRLKVLEPAEIGHALNLLRRVGRSRD